MPLKKVPIHITTNLTNTHTHTCARKFTSHLALTSIHLQKPGQIFHTVFRYLFHEAHLQLPVRWNVQVLLIGRQPGFSGNIIDGCSGNPRMGSIYAEIVN